MTNQTSIFNAELFPTPEPVIEKMLAPYIHNYSDRFDRDLKTLKFEGDFLDPQAGTGAILDYVTETLKLNTRHLKAIELETDLRYLLQGKGYTVIGSDFLEYDEPSNFGLIVANPPFSNGVKHALKIWEVLADGGDAVILLNRETVDNPYTNERQLLKLLIKEHGSVEYLGQCFANAERSTDVEVAMIRLAKPKKDSSIDFNDLQMESDGGITDAEFAANPLAHRNIIRDMVARYNTALCILRERSLTQSKLDFYLQGIQPAVYDSCDRNKQESLRLEVSLPDQVSALKSRFWNTVFSKTRMGEKTTSHFHRKFDEFASGQANMAFTERNIHEVLEMFFLNQNEIMQECLVEVFDKLSAYHKDNKIHTEGWKTNKSWRLNKKIIHPYGIRYDNVFGFATSYSHENIYTDLDKVLCYISGASTEKGVTTDRAIYNFIHLIRDGRNYRSEFESYFFKIRIFKKGTVHLVFKDLKLLNDFNLKAAEGKKWLGDGS